jgi:hypothetical protein
VYKDHRNWIIRSLGRNDVEIAALAELNRSLRAARAKIVQSCGELVLLDLGTGRLTLVGDELHEETTTTTTTNSKTKNRNDTREDTERNDDADDGTDGREEDVGRVSGRGGGVHGKDRDFPFSSSSSSDYHPPPPHPRHRLTPLQKELCVDFLSRMKLRRKLSNRLIRRLNRVAHAMDGTDVSPPLPPRYGDLRLNVDAEAVAERVVEWDKQERAKERIRATILLLKSNGKTLPASSSTSSSFEEAHQPTMEAIGSQSSKPKQDPTSNDDEGDGTVDNNNEEEDEDKGANRVTETTTAVSEGDHPTEGGAKKTQTTCDQAKVGSGGGDGGDSSEIEMIVEKRKEGLVDKSTSPAVTTTTTTTISGRKEDSKSTSEAVVSNTTDHIGDSNGTSKNDGGEDNNNNNNKNHNNTVRSSLTSSLMEDYATLQEYDSAYEKVWDNNTTAGRFKYVLAEQQPIDPEYTHIKHGEGVGAIAKIMTVQEREAEYKRWESNILARIPDQPTFEELGLKNRVFSLDVRRKRCFEEAARDQREADAAAAVADATATASPTKKAKVENHDIDDDDDDDDQEKVAGTPNRRISGKELRKNTNSDDDDDDDDDKMDTKDSDDEGEGKTDVSKKKKKTGKDDDDDDEEEDDDDSSDMFAGDDDNSNKETANKKAKGGKNGQEGTEESIDNKDRATKHEEEEIVGTKDIRHDTMEAEIRPKRPMSLIAVPSFYEQDIARIRMIHKDLMSTSITNHARQRLTDVTKEYNKGKCVLICFGPSVGIAVGRAIFLFDATNVFNLSLLLPAYNLSNELFDTCQRLQHNLTFAIAKGRQELTKATSEYAATFNLAKETWLKEKRDHDLNRANALLPSKWGRPGYGTEGIQDYIRRRSNKVIHVTVGQALADIVHGSLLVANRQATMLPKFREFVPPPNDPNAVLSTEENMTQRQLRVETEYRNKYNAMSTKFQESEAERGRAWRKMMKTKAELDVPHDQSLGSSVRRGKVDLTNYHLVPLPPLRSSSKQTIPRELQAQAAPVASYTPPNTLGSTSKYSAAKIKARKSADGTVAPVSEPKMTRDGLYMRPAGRTRKGMQWDAVNGVWVPDGGQ